MTASLQGRVAIVTGAAGALGAAVVNRFAELGATVAQLDVVALDNEHYADVCDLTDADDCARAVAAISDSLGGVDVLANIAGGFAMAPLGETPGAEFERLMRMNALTCFNACREAAARMGERGGRLVNVTARPALVPTGA